MEPDSSLKSISDKTVQFYETSVELVKLQAIDKTSNLAALIFSNIVIVITMAMFVLLLSIGISFEIGYLLQSTALGFIIVGTFYLLLSLFFLIFRKQILSSPIREKIIAHLLKDNTNDA